MTENRPDKKLRVHFEPDNVDIAVAPGANLLETAIAAGVHINASCGGNGTCGTCKVLIEQGEVKSFRTAKVSPGRPRSPIKSTPKVSGRPVKVG